MELSDPFVVDEESMVMFNLSEMSEELFEIEIYE